MNKIFHVALREFIATVATKGFILGIVLTPLIILIAIFGMTFLFNEEAPKIQGQIAVLDPTGQIFEGLHEYLQPRAIAERRGDLEELVGDQVPEELQQLARPDAGNEITRMALDSILGSVPQLDVISLANDADLDQAKAPLRAKISTDGGRLAVIVIHQDAVIKSADKQRFGNYDLFVREKFDDRIENEIQRGLRRSIVDARVRAVGLDRDQIDALTTIGRVRSTTVTDEGEKTTNEIFNALMPMGFMMLLFVSVLTGGQYLMTSTIEEKSNRVVEVLLSAVSPMQLMTGKIIGQMVVGFLILGLYAGMGVSSLFAFAMAGLLDFSLIFYLIIFYVLAYFVIASLMAAIGAAVNEMREAQTLMTPVMMTLIIPWILWMPISRDPNSVFATTLSFIPPVSNFVMLLRMTSTTPPPLWQVWLSIAVGAASVYAAVWFAAKVFRIGLLMYGKPPNFRTLIRWVRMA